MTIRKICSRSIDVVATDESVVTAAQRMHSRKVGTLVVLDKDKRPVGMITDRDLAIRVLADGKDPLITDVEAVMTCGVQTVTEDCTIEDALEIMRSGPFRRLPVVDGEGDLLGLLSVDDVLNLLADEFRSIRGLIHAEGPHSLAGV